MQEWLRDQSLNVLEWPSQNMDLNLKIAVQHRSPNIGVPSLYFNLLWIPISCCQSSSYLLLGSRKIKAVYTILKQYNTFTDSTMHCVPSVRVCVFLLLC